MYKKKKINLDTVESYHANSQLSNAPMKSTQAEMMSVWSYPAETEVYTVFYDLSVSGGANASIRAEKFIPLKTLKYEENVNNTLRTSSNPSLLLHSRTLLATLKLL